MTVSIVNSTIAGNNSPSLSVTIPSGVTIGNLLIAVGMSATANAITGPTGWTQIAGTVTTGATSQFQNFAYWKVVASGDAGSSATISHSATAKQEMAIIEISGADTTSPIDVDQFTGFAAQGTARTAPSGTATSDGLGLMVAMDRASGTIDLKASTTFTWPSGWSQVIAGVTDTGTNTGACGVGIASESVTNGSTVGGGTVTFQYNNARQGVWVLSVKAAGATTVSTTDAAALSVSETSSLAIVNAISTTDAASISVSETSSVSVISNAALTHTWSGDPLADGFVVTAKTTGATSVRMAVSTSSGMTSPTYFGAVTPDAAGYVSFTATGLSAGTQYYYQFLDTPSGGSETAFGGVNLSHTTKATGSPQNFNVAFSACGQNNAPDGTALTSITSWAPDFFIHLGDFHYQSSTSTDYTVHRGLLENQIQNYAGMKTFLQNVPMVYVNSDHEAGPDNGDSDNDYSLAFNQAFKEVVPARLVDTANPPIGKYRSWGIGRVKFILIDIRNHDRSPGANTDDSSKTMLGATQKAWLKTELSDPNYALKVILSDVPWMGTATLTNGTDKWWAYSTERQEIADYIVNNQLRVDFWHGDSHRLAVDQTHNSTTGKFPVICAAGLYQTGGGAETDGTWDQEWDNYPSIEQIYMRVSITDDGNKITRVASGWDAVNNIERVSQTYTWVISSGETPSISVSETSSISGTTSTTDTSAISVAETSSVSITISTTDTAAISVAETSSISGTMSTTDACAVSVAETSSISGTVTTTDATAVSVAETSSISGTMSTADTTAVSVVETSAPVVNISSTEATAVSVVEASGISGSMSTTDAAAVSVVETSSPFVTFGSTEAAAVSVVEASSATVTMQSTEAAAISVVESSSVFNNEPSTDGTGIGVAESSSVFITQPTTDTSAISVAENSSISGTMSTTDATAISVTENSSVAVAQASTEAAAVSVSETSSISGSVSTTDACAISVTEVSSVLVTLSTTDTTAVSVAETQQSNLSTQTNDFAAVSVDDQSNAMSVYIQTSDGPSISVDDQTSSVINSFSSTESTAVSVAETSSIFGTVDTTEAAAISISDSSSVNPNAPASDFAAVSVAESSSVSGTMSSSEACAISVTESSSVLVIFSTTDTAAVSVAETDNTANPLSTTETAAVSINETSQVDISGTVTVSSTDTAAIIIAESNSFQYGLASSDSAAISVSETSGVSGTMNSTDQTALSVTETSQVDITSNPPVGFSSTDQASISVSEFSIVVKRNIGPKTSIQTGSTLTDRSETESNISGNLDANSSRATIIDIDSQQSSSVSGDDSTKGSIQTSQI